MAKNCGNSFRNERLVPPRFLKLLQDVVRLTLFEHEAYSVTGIYPDNLPFCFRLYKSREVLQNTVTYWILCKFTTLRKQGCSAILEQPAQTFDHCVEHANDG